MKTKLLWTLILSVGTPALYFGVRRPEVTTTPKRIQDYIAVDPATRPAIQLPAFEVSEPRLPAASKDAAEVASEAKLEIAK